jgi:hypothetical protein
MWSATGRGEGGKVRTIVLTRIKYVVAVPR